MSEPGPLLDEPLLPGMIGQSAAMRPVFEITRLAAQSSATVLLTGETGTGKELVARAIHELSPRSTGPYVRVNCGALSETLLESELFGHVKGAFTNAIDNRTGRFEAAHGGTIFLDEINSMSFPLQVKLLRVLQEHEFERVGDSRTFGVDCRIVAATNRNLVEEINEERFREDLYYRLNVIPIDLPPLRQRVEDIEQLAKFFLKKYAAKNQKPELKLSNDVVEYLKKYTWPGNVRELENYMERAVVLCRATTVSVKELPEHVQKMTPPQVSRRKGDSLHEICTEMVTQGLSQTTPQDNNLHERIVSIVEKELIKQVLRMCQGVQTKTATRLGINRNTLHKKIDDYQLQGEAR